MSADPDADDRVTAVLRARALALAERLSDHHAPAAEQSLEVLEFRIGGQRYAVETRFVAEVFPLTHLTPVPCTPSYVLGIVNVRGRVATVLGLTRFFAMPEQGLADLHRVVLLGDGDIGLLADLSVNVRRIDRSELEPPLPPLADGAIDYVRGVLPDGLVVLDIERVLSDPRLEVDEEPDQDRSLAATDRSSA